MKIIKTEIFKEYYSSLARSRGRVVKVKDSQLSGCGFESWHHILHDVSNITLGKRKEKKKYSSSGNSIEFSSSAWCMTHRIFWLVSGQTINLSVYGTDGDTKK